MKIKQEINNPINNDPLYRVCCSSADNYRGSKRYGKIFVVGYGASKSKDIAVNEAMNKLKEQLETRRMVRDAQFPNEIKNINYEV